MNNESKRPIHEIRIGSIKAAIWRHANPEGRERYSIRIARFYREGNQQAGTWKSTDCFGRDDLLVVAKVADVAHSWCLNHPLGERER